MSKVTLDAPIAPERDDYKSQLSADGYYTILDALGFVIGSAKSSEDADLICDALNDYDPGAEKISESTASLIEACEDEMDIDDLLENVLTLADYDVDVLKFLQKEIERQASKYLNAKAAADAKRVKGLPN